MATGMPGRRATVGLELATSAAVDPGLPQLYSHATSKGVHLPLSSADECFSTLTACCHAIIQQSARLCPKELVSYGCKGYIVPWPAGGPRAL